jgi:hypothetical protein
MKRMQGINDIDIYRLAKGEIENILNLYREEREKSKSLDKNLIKIIDDAVFETIINNKYSNRSYDIKLEPNTFNYKTAEINKLLGYDANTKSSLLIQNQRYNPVNDKYKYLYDSIPTTYFMINKLNIDFKPTYFDYEYIYPFVLFKPKNEYGHRKYFEEFKNDKIVLIDSIQELKKDEDKYYCNKLYSYYQNSKYKHHMDYKENNFLMKLVKGSECVLTINKYDKEELKLLSS